MMLHVNMWNENFRQDWDGTWHMTNFILYSFFTEIASVRVSITIHMKRRRWVREHCNAQADQYLFNSRTSVGNEKKIDWLWYFNYIIHHTYFRRKLAFSITGELQLEATDQCKGKHGNQKKIELICPHEILFLNKTTSMVIQHISSQLFWRKWKWSK